MPNTVQIMVLPASVSEAPPEVLLDDGGIWRDMKGTVFASQTEIMQKLQRTVAQAVALMEQGHSVNANGLRAPFADLFLKLVPPEVREALKEASQQERPQL